MDKDNQPKFTRMNRSKQANIAIEKRLRAVALWECTRGNRRMTNNEEVFEQARAFRRMLEVGMFASLEEMEFVVFDHWGLAHPVNVENFEFMDVNPTGGG